MKKYLLLTLCLIFSFSIANGWMGSMMVGGGTPASVGCAGDLKWSWYMEDTDITADTPAGCSDGSAKTAVLVSSATIATDQYYDGSESLKVVSSTDYASFANFDGDEFDFNEGKIIFYFMINVYVDSAVLLKISYDGTDFLSIYLSPTGDGTDIKVGARYVDGYLLADSSGVCQVDEWIRVTYQWKVSESAADHALEICDNLGGTPNCFTDGPEDDLGTWAGAANSCLIGSVSTQNITGWIDGIEIYATSGL